MQSSSRIAVVGAGISGLSAAWLLSRLYDVTLFEQNTRTGGHSNTVDTMLDGITTPVDTGFIVYNTQSYPNLVALFQHLDVPTARSDMSFAVSLYGGSYEYSGTGFGGIFGQPVNLVRSSHLRMLADIRRFFREAPKLLAPHSGGDVPLGHYLREHCYSVGFIDRHILPMAAAIWSMPARDVLNFPAASFVRFFSNHGLLQIRNRPEWRTVLGGSREYVARLLRDYRGKVVLGAEVGRVTRDDRCVSVSDRMGNVQRFDQIVIAAHADEALAMLGDADRAERQLLGCFKYQANLAVLHSDRAVMPRRRRVWSSWNYCESPEACSGGPSVTYWMNRLQPLGRREDVFVTLNPSRSISEDHIRGTFSYAHPIFDAAAIEAQRSLWSLQGRRRTWFCGSYFGYGFHEDGLQSGLAAAEDLGDVRRPWSVAEESGRIHLPQRDADRRVREAAE